MTQELERAFAKAAALSEDKQDAIAALIIEEIESDNRWRRSFAGSKDELAGLAREAREQYAAGKTVPLDPDSL